MYPSLSLTQAALRFSPRVGFLPYTLQGWTSQIRVDQGMIPGTTAIDADRTMGLGRQVKDIGHFNELILAFSSVLTREFDSRLPW